MDRRIPALSASTNTGQLRGGTELSLWFASGPQIELIRTNFKSPMLPEPVTAVRGKTSGAYSTEVTFQWTSAVQSLSTLLLKATARQKLNMSLKTPLLEGGKGSMASSLDASLYKQTSWLDMFGSNIRGDSLSKRVFLRTNPGRRRFGPVLISLNDRLIPSNAIKIYVDSRLVTDGRVLLQYANSIEDHWNSTRGLSNPLVGPQLPNPLRIY